MINAELRYIFYFSDRQKVLRNIFLAASSRLSSTLCVHLTKHITDPETLDPAAKPRDDSRAGNARNDE